MTKVGFSTRVVAAGWTEEKKVRLTVSIFPVAEKPASSAETIDLETWPKAIFEEVQNWGGNNEKQIEAAGLSTEAGRAAPGEFTAVKIKKLLDAPTAHLENVTNFWKDIVMSGNKLVAGDDHDIWDALRDVIAESSFGQAEADILREPYFTAEKLPRVVPLGREESALLQLINIADRTTASLQLKDTRSAKPEVLPVGEAIDLTEDLQKSKSEAKKRGEDEEKYKMAKPPPDESDPVLQPRLQAVANAYAKRRLYLTTENSEEAVRALVQSTSSAELGYLIDHIFQQPQTSTICSDTRALHEAATFPDVKGANPDDLPTEEEVAAASEIARKTGREPTYDPKARLRARELLFAMRSYPVLARLFGFVVDLEVDLASLPRPPAATSWFGFLRGPRTVGGSVATLFKAEMGSPPSFYPATREELDLSDANYDVPKIRDSGKATTLNGVVDLGAATEVVVEEGREYASVRRFAIVTNDPGQSAETRSRAADRAKNAEKALNEAGAPVEVPAALRESESNAMTRGFVLLDRWRASSIVNELACAVEPWKKDDTVILDADDLTIGYRLDVGTAKGANPALEWRSLGEREISYFKPGQDGAGAPDDIEKWLGNGALKFEMPRRRDLDAAVSAPTVRRRRFIEDSVNAKNEMLHADEGIATWEGDPLGVTCVEYGQAALIDIDPGKGLAISRRIGLPTANDKERGPTADRSRLAPKLRFGWAYAFGLRPVFLGGACIPLNEATKLYDGPASLALPKPRGETKSFQRFLRIERVLRPQVLLPLGVATKPDRLAKQSARTVTLRTLSGKNLPAELRERSEPGETWRVILPAQLGLEQAMRHGRFDRGVTDEVPSGDFANIDFDAEWGGFPVYGGDVAPGDTVQLSRVSLQHVTEKKRDGTTKMLPPKQQGETVFKLQKRNETRKRADRMQANGSGIYYADPAADTLVLAFRPAGTQPGTSYIEGNPITVKITDRNGLPRPVAIVFKRPKLVAGEYKKRPTDKVTEHAHFLENIKSGKIGDGVSPTDNPYVDAQIVTLVLHPGDAFDLDCWTVPSERMLTQCFDLPETLAIRALERSRAKFDDERSVDQILNEMFKDFKKVTTPNPQSWVGHGDTVVYGDIVKSIAGHLHRSMLRRPIADIASVETIQLTHAIDKPMAPSFDAKPIDIHRVAANDDARRIALHDLCKGQSVDGKPGDSTFVLSGEVLFDRDTSRRLLVRTQAVAVRGLKIDDPERGRSHSDRLTGNWRGVIPVTPKLKSPDGDEKKARKVPPTRALYGFEVDAHGCVTLPRQEVTLLELDAIGAPGAGQPKNHAREPVDLVQEQLNALPPKTKDGEPNANPGRVTSANPANRSLSLDPFGDHLARKLIVTLRAGSRHAPHFRFVAAAAKRSPNPESERNSFLAEDDYVPEQESSLTTDSTAMTMPIWLRATRRPDKPVIHAIDPVFGSPAIHKEGNWRVYRCEPSLRIYLDRPWYTSGEGERLGIVLWPPRINGIEPPRLADGYVPRGANKNMGEMDLWNFDDADLGEAGKFVTRLGADPIRFHPKLERGTAGSTAPRPIGPFMGRHSFLDLRANRPTPEPGEERSCDPTSAIAGKIVAPLKEADDNPAFVDCITLPADQDGFERASDESANTGTERKPVETLQVALGTFVPRFHPDIEKWFVDVHVDPGAAPEPFLRFGLVRYQQYSLPGIECSAPLSSWAQIPAAREVRVCVEAVPNPGQSSDKSKTKTKTRTRAKQPEAVKWKYFILIGSKDSSGERAPKNQGPTSAMLITLRREHKNAAGLPVKDIVCKAEVARGSLSSAPEMQEPNGWGADFVVPALGKGDAPYEILIEEVERMPSTDNEPSRDPKDEKYKLAPESVLATSGPRFLLLQKLEQPAPKPVAVPKPRQKRKRNDATEPAGRYKF